MNEPLERLPHWEPRDDPRDAERSSGQIAISRLLATVVVLLDVSGVSDSIGLSRADLAMLSLVGLLCLNNGDRASLGLIAAPIQGWRYWCRLAVWFAGLVALFMIVSAAIWHLMGWPISWYRRQPSLGYFLLMCVRAPVGEEIVYRGLLTVAALPSFGRLGTIVLSGSVFALVHVLGGNPSPENQIAGFLLAWAFLKSQTILVPIAMHSAGNLIAFASQTVGWCWLGELPA